MVSRYHCFAFNVVSCSLTFLFCFILPEKQIKTQQAELQQPAQLEKEHLWGEQRAAPSAEQCRVAYFMALHRADLNIWTKNLNGQLPFVGCGWQNYACLCRYQFLPLYGNVTFIFIKSTFGNTSAPNALHFKHFLKVLHKKVISPKIQGLSYVPTVLLLSFFEQCHLHVVTFYSFIFAMALWASPPPLQLLCHISLNTHHQPPTFLTSALR